MKALTIFSWFYLLSTVAQAQTLQIPTSAEISARLDSGKYNLPYCKGQVVDAPSKNSFEQNERGYCAGMVAALIQIGDRLQPKDRFCKPDAASTKDGMRIVVSYLEGHSNRLNEKFVDLGIEALRRI